MEFMSGGRLEVRLTAADVGKRVSIRQLTGAVDGTEKFTDTVGVLTSWTDGVLHITRRSGEIVRIPEAALVAGKVVPATPARRRGPSATFEELSRTGARAWQPVESEWLGGWQLRASGGFTRRANSVLPVKDPGLELDEALDRVRRWYAERGLPAYLQIATGAADTQEALAAEVASRGWRPEVTAEVRTAALAPIADLTTGLAGEHGLAGAPDRAGTGPVLLTRSCDDAWLRRYQRSTAPGPHMRQVLNSGPSVWFASIPGPRPRPNTPAAIGRCVVDGRWAGFMAVEVDPAHRRRGLATAVMAALAGRALDEGASAAWLQVEADNIAAREMYERMGFAVHHHYQHVRSPSA